MESRSRLFCTFLMVSLLLAVQGDKSTLVVRTKLADLVKGRNMNINYTGVSPTCASNMQLLQIASQQHGRYHWADTWENADGRGTWPDKGAFLGNVFAMGSYDLCYTVKGTWEDVFIKDNNGTDVKIGVFDFNTHYCKATYRTAEDMVGISEGWCVPESCGLDDVKQIMPPIPGNWRHVYCGAKPTLKDNVGAIVALVITSFFVALVLMATIIDGVSTWFKERKNAMDVENSTPPVELIGKKNMACDVAETDLQSGNTKPMEPMPVTPMVAEEKKPSAPYRALISFSLFKSLPLVLQSGGARARYSSLNGLRFIAMIWIVLGHVFQLDLYLLADPRNMLAKNYFGQFDLMQNLGYQLIDNSHYAVEVFFFLSGTLVTLSFMKTLQRLEKTSHFGRFKEVLLYVFHRYWRLTPLFAAIMMIYSNLWWYMGSGPLFPETLASADNCRSNWWAHLLYIHNFYRGSGDCMAMTWYLANDFQFYLIVPLFAFFLYWKPVFGGIFLFLGWAGSLVARGVLHSYTGIDDFWDIYVKPWCRFGPYAQGIAMGYIIFRTKCKVKIPAFVAILGWAAAIALSLAVVIGTKNYQNYPKALKMAVDTTKRDAFTLGIAWTVFACLHGYGGLINTFLSWNFFAVLSQLTYCGYLIHPFVNQVSLIRRQHLLYVQDITMVYQYVATTTITLVCSLGLTCVFEVPFLALEKVILPSHKK